MRSLKDSCWKYKVQTGLLWMMLLFTWTTFVCLVAPHRPPAIRHPVSLWTTICSVSGSSFFLSENSGLLLHTCISKLHVYTQTGKMCAVLADGRGDGDGLQRHVFPGHSPVGGRQVLLHHQSAGAAEFKCRPKHDRGISVNLSGHLSSYVLQSVLFHLLKIETESRLLIVAPHLSAHF